MNTIDIDFAVSVALTILRKEHPDWKFEIYDESNTKNLGLEIRGTIDCWGKGFYICLNFREKKKQKCVGFKHETLNRDRLEKFQQVSSDVETIRTFSKKSKLYKTDKAHWPLWRHLSKERLEPFDDISFISGIVSDINEMIKIYDISISTE